MNYRYVKSYYDNGSIVFYRIHPDNIYDFWDEDENKWAPYSKLPFQFAAKFEDAGYWDNEITEEELTEELFLLNL